VEAPARSRPLSGASLGTWLSRIGLLGGGLLLVVSAARPWFRVPVGDGAGGVTLREAAATVPFKLLALAGVAAVAMIRTRARRPRRAGASAAAVLLVILLLFPHCVTVWCPEVAGEASWLHAQHQSLSWFGGDVYGLQEYKGSNSRDRVYASDLLAPADPVGTPAWSPRAVPFGRPRDLFDWFGYSVWFPEFAGLGWGLALAGALALLLGLCREERGPSVAVLWAAGRAGLAAALAGAALALVPAVLCALRVEQAHRAATFGRYAEAEALLGSAGRFAPIVRQNSDFALQQGLLQARLGIPSPEADLYRAKVLQQDGRLERADAVFAALVGRIGASGSTRREALRALLRRAIRQLNSGELASAAQGLEWILRVDPCNLKANYVLQLADLRAARFDRVSALVGRMRVVYRGMHVETKVPVLAAAQENLAHAAFERGDVAAAAEARRRAVDAKWLVGR
jgi:tetratricopeptide (TPR) repeat protein